jgi:hypothetical protein
MEASPPSPSPSPAGAGGGTAAAPGPTAGAAGGTTASAAAGAAPGAVSAPAVPTVVAAPAAGAATSEAGATPAAAPATPVPENEPGERRKALPQAMRWEHSQSVNLATTMSPQPDEAPEGATVCRRAHPMIHEPTAGRKSTVIERRHLPPLMVDRKSSWPETSGASKPRQKVRSIRFLPSWTKSVWERPRTLTPSTRRSQRAAIHSLRAKYAAFRTEEQRGVEGTSCSSD